MNHSVGNIASPSKGTWAAAAARQFKPTTRTLTLLKTGEEICTTLLCTYPADNYGTRLSEVLEFEQATLFLLPRTVAEVRDEKQIEKPTASL